MSERWSELRAWPGYGWEGLRALLSLRPRLNLRVSSPGGRASCGVASAEGGGAVPGAVEAGGAAGGACRTYRQSA